MKNNLKIWNKIFSFEILFSNKLSLKIFQVQMKLNKLLVNNYFLQNKKIMNKILLFKFMFCRKSKFEIENIYNQKLI